MCCFFDSIFTDPKELTTKKRASSVQAPLSAISSFDLCRGARNYLKSHATTVVRMYIKHIFIFHRYLHSKHFKNIHFDNISTKPYLCKRSKTYCKNETEEDCNL